MTEPALAALAPAPQQGDKPLPAWQAALLSAGAQQFDPARFHYLELLSQRVDQAQGELRRMLQARLEAAVADYGQRFAQAQQAARDDSASLPAPSVLRRPGAPLAELNQYILSVKAQASDAHQRSDPGSSLAGDQAAASEMASVRRFRQAWSRMAAEDQLAQAVVRGPANAGPLNSHMLVLRSLALMRELSPDYLRRFMSHVDSLLWLEQASQKYTPVKAKAAPKAARRSPKKK